MGSNHFFIVFLFWKIRFLVGFYRHFLKTDSGMILAWFWHDFGMALGWFWAWNFCKGPYYFFLFRLFSCILILLLHRPPQAFWLSWDVLGLLGGFSTPTTRRVRRRRYCHFEEEYNCTVQLSVVLSVVVMVVLLAVVVVVLLSVVLSIWNFMYTYINIFVHLSLLSLN